MPAIKMIVVIAKLFSESEVSQKLKLDNFCLFKKRLENVKSIRTLKQDRSKAKTSLKSVLSLQVNINIPKIEKDHQKKIFGNNRQKRRL